MSDFTKNRITKSDDYETPKDIYEDLNAEFHFNDDPCPLFGQGLPLLDGLSREWGSSVFMNPPYSDPLPWCRKAVEEMKRGKLVVGLLRGDTSTEWFHEYILPYAEIRFVRGRIKWTNGGRCPFASIIAIWRPV